MKAFETMARSVVLAVSALAGASACAPLAEEPASGRRAESFERALAECRRAHPGKTNRRLRLSADHPDIAACLQQAGWLPDGRRQT